MPSRWRRHRPTLAVLALLAAAVAYDRVRHTPAPGNDHDRYHGRTFRVARVVDGDTLDIDAPDGNREVTRIRLWGVDTPETGTGPEPPAYFGPEAKAFAVELLDGRQVHIVLAPTRTRDKYHRLLAYVFLERGGAMFNERLLEEGTAYADWRFDHAYADRFEAIEKQARRTGRGLWRDISDDKLPPWRRRMEHREAARRD
ncbi:MAG: thermonuclease family protein [Planctomycetes bacterium]|nr:thermonuclease family protein [Planctomycetota bacterium]